MREVLEHLTLVNQRPRPRGLSYEAHTYIFHQRWQRQQVERGRIMCNYFERRLKRGVYLAKMGGVYLAVPLVLISEKVSIIDGHILSY